LQSISPRLAARLADLLLIGHFCIVAFAVGMVPLAWIGRWQGWRWIRNPWLRRAHLAVMAVIALIALLGQLCPLTIWEQDLRERAGQITYEGSFIGHWVGGLLYVDLPLWVFPALYAGWFFLTLWTWRRVRQTA
jgi:hypothetical protein